jgi:large subunit ribosomal protein L24
MLKFKKEDLVKITSGKDKAREGKIEIINPVDSTVIIAGINLVKKHVKGKPGIKGGIYEIPKPLPFSKIELICPKCKKVSRIGFKFSGNEKVRICKKCGREIDSK